MKLGIRSCWLLLVAGLAAAGVARANVVVAPWGPTTTEHYDPAHPPDDLDELDGDATADLNCSGGAFHGTWDPATNKLTITSQDDVNLSGHTAIRLPTGAGQDLIDHENGHDHLNKYEYDKHAKQKMEDAFRGFVGMTFTGVGENDSLRALDADAKADAEVAARLARGCSAIRAQMQALADEYDKLTDHGRSETESNAKGETDVKAAHDAAKPAGKPATKPDGTKQSAHTDEQFGAYFDPLQQQLVFAMPAPIAGAHDVGDPIAGRGHIELQPMIAIGPHPDGTVRLADAALRIVDAWTGDTLLEGWLIEAAYLPAALPAHPDMIQGWLDVPPAFANGVHNTIGSAFLDAMQAASDLGQPTGVWLYPSSPMFDATGACIVPPAGVPLSVTVGIADPATLAVGDVPPRVWLASPYPAPFRRECTVRFRLGALERASVRVHDATGALVRVLPVAGREAGWAWVTWDGRRGDGGAAAPGVYFVSIVAGNRAGSSRLVLLR